MRIEEIGLTFRTYVRLKKAGIDTLEQLKETDLDGIENLGTTHKREIKVCLEELGG